MEDYERQVKLKFKLLATFYDLFEIPLLLNEKGNPRYALARKIPNEDLHILDVCIGTGNSAIAVAEVNNRNEIVGVDLSPDMIAVAEKKIRRRRIRNISIRQMDATRMTFRDGEFDIAMISFALHELDYALMLGILKEMCRVLKESGKLYIVDYEREDGFLKSLVLAIQLKLFEPSHMPQFLRYDWVEILQSTRVQVTATEKYLFSKLICAVKQSNAERTAVQQAVAADRFRCE